MKALFNLIGILGLGISFLIMLILLLIFENYALPQNSDSVLR
jgi:hypothetical protein